jgi:hypothetical protein
VFISQKTTFFIITAVRSSNLARATIVCVRALGSSSLVKACESLVSRVQSRGSKATKNVSCNAELKLAYVEALPQIVCVLCRTKRRDQKEESKGHEVTKRKRKEK